MTTKLLIFTGDNLDIKNPCKGCKHLLGNDCEIYETELLCPVFNKFIGKLSILNQCVEVDLDKQLFKYIHIHFGKEMAEQLNSTPLFSKFIFQTPQEQLPTRTDIGNKPW